MKVLIMGITGMIGQHFAEAFEKEGAQVVGLARSSSASRQAGQDDKRIIRCDILDYESLRKVVQNEKRSIDRSSRLYY
ncbi:MAG: GDP-4-dehydro-6-deoxy-D-mannose reductase [Patescibacteria group bacterium]|nr:GDP-4-dehydro-6-deoxy-D-mannose reductase [Patescibacteria group bacterium]